MARTKQTSIKKTMSAPMAAAKSIRRQKKTALNAADPAEPKKRRKRRPGNAAIAEIRKEQKSTEILILAAPFKRIVDDLLQGDAWQLCPRDSKTAKNELGQDVSQPCSHAYSGKGVWVADPDFKGSLPSRGDDGAPGDAKPCRSLDGSGALVPAAQMGVRWSNEALEALRVGCESLAVDTFRDANAINLAKWTPSRAPVTLRPEDMDAAFTLRSNERYAKMNTGMASFGTADVRHRAYALEQEEKLRLKRQKRRAALEDVGKIARKLKNKQAAAQKQTKPPSDDYVAEDTAEEERKLKLKKKKKLKAGAAAAAATAAAAAAALAVRGPEDAAATAAVAAPDAAEEGAAAGGVSDGSDSD
jgi:histone H3/H4